MITHTIRAKLMFQKKTYRDIEIGGEMSLYRLAEAIVGSFDFDFDHAFGFYDNLGEDFYDSPIRYELFADMGEDWDDGDGRPKAKSVKKTSVGQAFTEPKQKIQFVFDYGDEWCFELEVRGIGERARALKHPRVISAKGEAPEQYPPEDDEDWDSEDWDEDD